MQHFPIFIALSGQSVVLAGGGAAALAKLRLLMKTPARITVYAARPAPEIAQWAAQDQLTLRTRALTHGDVSSARLFYAATEDAAEDARTAAIARAEGALVNIVDNLADSQFITPAIVDRDPVVVAIGTEGAAPVLARLIKADIEARLPVVLGQLARIGQSFRRTARVLAPGRARRDFWSEFYFSHGPRAQQMGGDDAVKSALSQLFERHLASDTGDGRVDLVGAGPGDPELLTLKARRALDRADVVIHDRLVAPQILELARREAVIIAAGKQGFGPAVAQEDINRMIVDHAKSGAHVVRLKSGDPTVFGRLDEEIEACEAAGVAWSVVPGITAASAAVAAIGQSMTRRGRNSTVRFLTGHDTAGFADHDWRTLARPGEVAAIYMGKRAARFLQGRLMMHGADPATPVSVIENASRTDQRVFGATLGDLPRALNDTHADAPAVLLYGLAPRAALVRLETLEKGFA